MRGVVAEVRRQPWGVVLIVAPSNYPLVLPGVQLLQALVAGNAVLLKPGVGGLAAASRLVQWLVLAGLDAALVRVLPEAPEAAMQAIERGVDKVVLTGSASTGAKVLAALAPHLTPATMELSGCDAAFVRPDANPALVASALAFSLRLNGGATCIAPRRVFVYPPLAPRLEHCLVHRVRDLGPFDVAPDAFVLARQGVSQACQSGARLLCGGFESDARMRPIVLADVTPEMAVLRMDLFAPVLSLMGVADDRAALSAAAACPYALGAVVFGQEKRARELASQVRAGVVLINDVIVPTADPRLPFGGLGRSGYGVTRGAEGLLEMTAIKALSVRRGAWRPHYEPPHSGHAALFCAYIQAVHGASWRKRLAAVGAGLRTLRQLPRPWRRTSGR
jgi:acyl-CoA reductase-like NAD-dependent aldehyde dehydrogenase